MNQHDEYRWWVIGDKDPGDHTRHLPRDPWHIRILHFPGDTPFPSRRGFLRWAVLPYLVVMTAALIVLGLMIWGVSL